MGFKGAGPTTGDTAGAQESHLSSGTGTHPDHQGEHHGAGDTFGHREVAIGRVDDKCVIRVSWENLGGVGIWSLCCGVQVLWG